MKSVVAGRQRRVVEHRVAQVLHGLLLVAPGQLRRRQVGDDRGCVGDLRRVLLLEVEKRTRRPSVRGRGRAEVVRELLGRRIERRGDVRESGIGCDLRLAEAVLERKPTHAGEVGLDDALDLLLVERALELVVGARHHDLAAVDPALRVHVGGVGLGADHGTGEQAGQLGRHVADRHRR